MVKQLTIILVDEADKMNESLHKLMLGVLDKGNLTTGANETVDFSKTIIFFTSNAGNREVEGGLKDRRIGFSSNKLFKSNIDPTTKKKAIEQKMRKVMNKLIFYKLGRFSFNEISNCTLVADINADGTALDFYSVPKTETKSIAHS